MLEYKASDIQVLNEIEHLQLNPSMYVSRTNEPGHLIEEPFDNALDEALAGHATIIEVNLDTKNHIYSVTDNGRGIPIENDIPIIVSTKLFSGAKFRDRKSAYMICSGLHGVGLVTVLALSKQYMVEIYRNGKHAKFLFIQSKLKEKIIESFNGDKPFSTKIEFIPDKKYFSTNIPEVHRIRQRIFSASVELPNTIFRLNIDGNIETIKLDKDTHFKKNCLNDSDETISNIIDIKIIDSVELFESKFCYSWSGAITPRFISSVNLLPVPDGGCHVNLFYEFVKDYFTDKGKKSNLKFQPNDTLCGLRSYFNLRLIKPEFSGQAKFRLDNKKEDLERFINKLKPTFDEYFSKNPQVLVDILGHFEDYRKSIDSKKIKVSNGRRGSTKFTKLRECTNPNGELFIVEGDSAAGGFVQSRDPRKHAIFPLKGKIPSAVTKKEILENKEMSEMILSFGTGVGPQFDISKLKYNKIICTTDADDDGAHIAVLLTMNIALLTPEIIKQGKYFIAITPLYSINEKKTFIPLWTKEELDKAVNDKRNITRFKGLGELNPEQIKISILDEKTRYLIPVHYSENMDYLIKLLSDANEKRKLVEAK